MREHLIEEAKIVSYGLSKKGIVRANNDGILTENGEVLTDEELNVVFEYVLGVKS